MFKERQEFVAKTRREADELLEAARVQAERMVQRTEVVRAAEQRARQIMEAAEADARRCATRPRTSSTSASAASRSCSTSCRRRCTPVAQRLVDRRDPRRHEQHRRGRPDHGLLRPGPGLAGPPAGTRPRVRGVVARGRSVPASNRCCSNARELLRQPGTDAVESVLTVDREPASSVGAPTRARRSTSSCTYARGAERRHRRSAARSAVPWAACAVAAWRRSTGVDIGRRSTSSTRRPSSIPTRSVIERRPARSRPAGARDRAAGARRRTAVPAGLCRVVPDVR